MVVFTKSWKVQIWGQMSLRRRLTNESFRFFCLRFAIITDMKLFIKMCLSNKAKKSEIQTNVKNLIIWEFLLLSLK